MYFQPVYLNAKSSIGFLLIFMLNNVRLSNMANNDMDKSYKKQLGKLSSLSKCVGDPTSCSTGQDKCAELNYPCISCSASVDCIYGQPINFTCTVPHDTPCSGDRNFNRTAVCRFCYQTNSWEHRCVKKADCDSVSSTNRLYQTNCSVTDDIICLGKRQFLKKITCSWTDGTQWSTSLLLAITLGGFGADRFYLGHWQEGIGKLFSFGGLGVWTLVDTILIAIHHLGPADGSLYI